ncbi:MAG: hypothetical protein ABIJ08_04590, partial [Nanoarchaeota archaeon]
NELSLNIKTVIKRVNDLKKKKVITSFSIHVDPLKLGFEHHIMLLNIDTSKTQLTNKLVSFFDTSKEVSFVAFNVERWVHIELFVKHDLELQRFINRFRNDFSREIDDMVVVKTLSEPKEDFGIIARVL